jgi:hypothetical protein
MIFYVVLYDTDTGGSTVKQFRNEAEAFKVFKEESANNTRDNIQVNLLSAENFEELKKSRGRFFMGKREIRIEPLQ